MWCCISCGEIILRLTLGGRHQAFKPFFYQIGRVILQFLCPVTTKSEVLALDPFIEIGAWSLWSSLPRLC